jgi:predicted O-methyltransferase YrrM
MAQPGQLWERLRTRLKIKLPQRPRWPGFKAVLRGIATAPFRLLKFIVLLPVHLVKFLIKLPRRIWRAWKAAARALYIGRLKTAAGIRKGIYYVREGRRLRRTYLPVDRIRHALYVRFHPRRTLHGLACLRTRLRGRAVWDSVPGLAVVPRALTWARHYRRHLSRFRDIDAIRSIVYADETPIEGIKPPTPIGYRARRDSIRPRWGALLHGLVHLSETQRVLELGTAFGLSGLYIARGLLDSFPVRTCYFVTIERNRQFARIAEDNFDKLGYLDFVHVIQGDFETELERALDLIKPLQMAYIDGNHDCDATLRYVSQLKARARPGSLIILDDIHWSPEMTRAWRTIQQMPRVAATVDLWQWGIVVTGPRPTETDQACT